MDGNIIIIFLISMFAGCVIGFYDAFRKASILIPAFLLVGSLVMLKTVLTDVSFYQSLAENKLTAYFFLSTLILSFFYSATAVMCGLQERLSQKDNFQNG